MISHHPNAAKIAREYIGTDEPLERLGWGVDGVVYTHPSVPNAVKIHKNVESFNKELAAYQRLYDHHVHTFMGFAVPTLMTFSAKLQVLEISIVKPPCMLDFAAATVDKPNDFSDEAMEIWWADVADAFGDDFGVAADVFWAMKKEHGIFYWDLKPRNLQIR